MLDFTKFSTNELEKMLKEREDEIFKATFNPDLLDKLVEIEEIKKVLNSKQGS